MRKYFSVPEDPSDSDCDGADVGRGQSGLTTFLPV